MIWTTDQHGHNTHDWWATQVPRPRGQFAEANQGIAIRTCRRWKQLDDAAVTFVTWRVGSSSLCQKVSFAKPSQQKTSDWSMGSSPGYWLTTKSTILSSCDYHNKRIYMFNPNRRDHSGYHQGWTQWCPRHYVHSCHSYPSVSMLNKHLHDRFR